MGRPETEPETEPDLEVRSDQNHVGLDLSYACIEFEFQTLIFQLTMKRSCPVSEQYNKIARYEESLYYKISHKVRMDDVFEELIRCTSCIPAIASAHKSTQTIWADEDEGLITWWELSDDQMLWIETIDEINNILT